MLTEKQALWTAVRYVGTVIAILLVILGYGLMQNRDLADRAQAAKERPVPVDIPAKVRGPLVDRVYLVKVYASWLPSASGDRIEFKAYPLGSMEECKTAAANLTTRVKSGRIMATCWRIKEEEK